MLSFLKNHPFTVDAFFENSLVLTFATPKEQLQHLIPPCLTLDTFQDRWAFVAIAMVQTKYLRPSGFPRWMGNDFFLIGYRIFVRYQTSWGKNYRGLYIIKSQTDKKKMEWMGNLFTHYNYTTTDIIKTERNKNLTISSKGSNFQVTIDKTTDEVALPEQSPFADWKEARRFAGPLPFTFTFNSKTNEVLIIEGGRENWTPAPVRVIDYQLPFLQSLNLADVQLANAFRVENIPYSWKKGKIDLWK